MLLTVLPEAADFVLMRRAWSLLMIVFPEMTMPVTVTPESMEPTEMPWPPEQVLPLNTMLEPLLMARQSSWFLMTLFWIVRSVVLQSKPSVLWPAARPLLLALGESPNAVKIP